MIFHEKSLSRRLREAEENNWKKYVEARIDFFRSSISLSAVKASEHEAPLVVLRRAEINHGIVKINYFGLMALVARCDMFWEIFAFI